MKAVVPLLRYFFYYLFYIIIFITECGAGKDCKREQCCRGSCMATGIDPKRGFDAPQRSQYWMGDTLLVNDTVSFFIHGNYHIAPECFLLHVSSVDNYHGVTLHCCPCDHLCAKLLTLLDNARWYTLCILLFQNLLCVFFFLEWHTAPPPIIFSDLGKGEMLPA